MIKKSKYCFTIVLGVFLCIFSFLLGQKMDKRNAKNKETNISNSVQQVESEKNDEQSNQFDYELEKEQEEKEDSKQESVDVENINAENEYKAFILDKSLETGIPIEKLMSWYDSQLDDETIEDMVVVEKRLYSDPYYAAYLDTKPIYHGDEPDENIIKRVFDSSYGERQRRGLESIPFEDWEISKTTELENVNGYMMSASCYNNEYGIDDTAFLEINLVNERFILRLASDGG